MTASQLVQAPPSPDNDCDDDKMMRSMMMMMMTTATTDHLQRRSWSWSLGPSSSPPQAPLRLSRQWHTINDLQMMMIDEWSPDDHQIITIDNNCMSLPPLRLRREWHTIIQSTPLRRNSWWSPNYQMMNRWSDDHQITRWSPDDHQMITRWSDNTNIWRAFDDEPAFLFLSVSCPLISRSEGYPEDRGCIKTGWQR